MSSLWLIGLTTLFSVPIGVGAALYLEEYAQASRWRSLVQLNIANLAGVPSIVYGILGLGLFVRALALQRSILAGALTLTLVVLPIVILAAQEALRAVPDSIRQASYALGATRWQTVWHQVLPAATAGHHDGRDPGDQPRAGRSGAAGGDRRGDVHHVRADVAGGRVQRAAGADLRLDEPAAGRVPPRGGGGDHGAVDGVDPAECDGGVTCDIATESEFGGRNEDVNVVREPDCSGSLPLGRHNRMSAKSMQDTPTIRHDPHACPATVL